MIERQSAGSKSVVVETDSFDISAPPAALRSWQSIRKILPEVNRFAAIDLLKQPKQTKSLTIPMGELNPSLRVIQLSANEVRNMFTTAESLDRQWENFRKKFSGANAIVSFSPVGYSSDQNQAVFVVSFACGSLCGSGSIVLMQRAGTGWRIIKQSGLWVS